MLCEGKIEFELFIEFIGIYWKLQDTKFYRKGNLTLRSVVYYGESGTYPFKTA